jgi:uncharacterized protein (UPF0332 family)
MRGLLISWIRGMSKQEQSKQIFLAKAASKLRVAEYAIQQKEYETSASLLYYALFHTMQSALGLPPQGAWKHVAIARVFNSYCYQHKLLPDDILSEISEMYVDLYELRKRSDYSADEFSVLQKEDIEDYSHFLRKVIQLCSQQP